jgi:hypothetical protein
MKKSTLYLIALAGGLYWLWRKGSAVAGLGQESAYATTGGPPSGSENAVMFRQPMQAVSIVPWLPPTVPPLIAGGKKMTEAEYEALTSGLRAKTAPAPTAERAMAAQGMTDVQGQRKKNPTPVFREDEIIGATVQPSGLFAEDIWIRYQVGRYIDKAVSDLRRDPVSNVEVTDEMRPGIIASRAIYLAAKDGKRVEDGDPVAIALHNLWAVAYERIGRR